MKTTNYTSLSISQKLKELGFKGECNAWWYKFRNRNCEVTSDKEFIDYSVDIEWDCPAYTVQDILDVLKDHISEIRPCNAGVEVHRFITNNEKEYSTGKTLADALGLILIELIKKGIIKV